jgi:hypothetical protein
MAEEGWGRDTGNYSSSLLLPCVKYSSAIVIEESLTSRYIDNSIKESTYSVYRFIEIPCIRNVYCN